MLISKKWLSEFVSLPPSVSSHDIARRLTMSTVEVEGTLDLAKDLVSIVVGQIRSIVPHPNADKLKVCAVDIGKKKPIEIVCGGSNLREDMRVAVALPGARVKWHGEGELVELVLATIRGVASEGMIVASSEIGLSELFPAREEREIIDLRDYSAPPGTPLAKALYLDDAVFEIDHKSLSNRPDLWGQYGMARELSALFSRPLRPFTPPAIPKGNDIALAIDVKEKKLCRRYATVAVSNVTIGPSPQWMQARLRSVGIRPINIIVDITNYVMMETGNPMHAFDAEKIALPIIVRNAKEGETIMTLDGTERILNPQMLVIADKEKPLAIAGVMGGQASAITEKTSAIIFEAATFDPVSIRKTSAAIGLRTESSSRFEKGLDPELPLIALRRAVELTRALVKGSRVGSSVARWSTAKSKKKTISVPWEFFADLIGAPVPKKIIEGSLTRLGFALSKRAKDVRVVVPSWRATKDISIQEDLVEEVLRVWGYDRAVPRVPSALVALPPVNAELALSRRAGEVLAYECGLSEIMSYSFESPAWLETLGIDSGTRMALLNPVASDRPLIRRELAPNLLSIAEENAHRFDAVQLFEIGRVFHEQKNGDAEIAEQENALATVISKKHCETPFFFASSALARLCERLNVPFEIRKESSVHPLAHTGRSGSVYSGADRIGWIGELNPAIAERAGFHSRVAVSELSLDRLASHLLEKKIYAPILSYPEVARDIAFIVSSSVSHKAVTDRVSAFDPLIVRVELFDVFSGAGIPKGKKSMAYRIAYQSKEKTLESKDADLLHQKVGEMLKRDFDAEMR